MSGIRYYKLKEASIKTGLSKPTLYNYAKLGKIKYTLTPGGQMRYDISSIKTGEEPEIKKETETDDNKKICYCRVSTYGQRDDLKRQIGYMQEKYPNHEVIHDIGSGINFKRPGLLKIIEYGIEGRLIELVIAYKDRLCRIGYDLIETLLKKYSNTDIKIDSYKEETVNEEIANDILQIITVYTAKINGMRSYNHHETLAENKDVENKK